MGVFTILIGSILNQNLLKVLTQCRCIVPMYQGQYPTPVAISAKITGLVGSLIEKKYVVKF